MTAPMVQAGRAMADLHRAVKRLIEGTTQVHFGETADGLWELKVIAPPQEWSHRWGSPPTGPEIETVLRGFAAER